jgi:hypothetical protein
MYRFFVTDPIRFQKSIRVTIEHGHANNFANDYCSTAFWYQSEPHGAFPALPAAGERLPRAGTDTHDQAFLKFNEARKKLGKMTSVVQKQKLTTLDQEMKTAQAAIQKAEAAFDKEDFAAVVAACDEALKVLNPLLEQHGS